MPHLFLNPIQAWHYFYDLSPETKNKFESYKNTKTWILNKGEVKPKPGYTYKSFYIFQTINKRRIRRLLESDQQKELKYSPAIIESGMNLHKRRRLLQRSNADS